MWVILLTNNTKQVLKCFTGYKVVSESYHTWSWQYSPRARGEKDLLSNQLQLQSLPRTILWTRKSPTLLLTFVPRTLSIIRPVAIWSLPSSPLQMELLRLFPLKEEVLKNPEPPLSKRGRKVRMWISNPRAVEQRGCWSFVTWLDQKEKKSGPLNE